MRSDHQSWSEYRFDHHYYPKLKHWSDYQSKFAYLDSKGQGLMTFAGILGAALIVLVLETTSSSPQPDISPDRGKALMAASVGFIFVLSAIVALMFTFRTSVRVGGKKYAARFLAFESLFRKDDYLAREAMVDWYLDMRLQTLREMGEDRIKLQSKIRSVLKEENVDEHEVRAFADELFAELRTDVEAEVVFRHRCYFFAVWLTSLSLACLLMSFFLI